MSARAIAVLLWLAVAAPGAAAEVALHPQYGDVHVPGTSAVLHLGQHIAYIPKLEAQQVMVQSWGYAASDVSDVLGLILPQKGYGDWQATVTYKIEGHVDDVYADVDNSDEIKSAILESEPDQNMARRDAKVPTLEMQDWPQKPIYDKARHTLVWSREVAVGGEKTHALLANVATLNRTGVLMFRIVSDMDHAKEVAGGLKTLAKVTSFAPGTRYEDYRENADRLAVYDTLGLIEGDAGVQGAVHKTGWQYLQ
ncbi:MAG TPA: DUF2167 domain-containing protein, partial [Rhizomicrobium sp.]|nr:DUF2167 domain-containing protein [Rhizomicrobium sp.]